MKTSEDSRGIFGDLFKNSRTNAIIILDKKGIVHKVNDAFCEIFGYESKDVKGKDFKIFFTPEDIELKLPEIELETTLRKGNSDDKNYLINKNGSRTWVSGESILVKNNYGEVFIVKLIQSIQKIKELQQKVEEELEFSTNILISITDAIAVIDDNYTLKKTNPAFEKAFLNQSRYNQLLSNNEFLNSFAKYRADNTDDQWEINHGNNVYNLKFSLLKEFDSNRNYLLVITDITEKNYIEKQKDDMIAFVSHELKNPISSISMSNELIEEAINENNISESKVFLEKEKKNLRRLKMIVSELQEATRAGTGNLQFYKSSFNFKNLVYEIIETESYNHPNYKIECTTTSDITIRGDNFRIGQVISNFLTNSIKYSLPESKIIVGFKVENDALTFYVKDNGSGISSDQLPFVFTRYYRAPKTKKIHGLGLGLYLSKIIIEAHDGKIWAESEEGKGSAFYFSIPLYG